MKWAYYNDNDPFCAAWLKELMRDSLIMDGEIDTRSIAEVSADDVRGFVRCHWFCGIAGWDYALKLADWSETKPVWTGSCPCQPLSVAGQRKGHADQRHLWPAFYRLISECRPATLFGEQVASKDGREWLAGVRADMEALGYAVGAADLCAAGVAAPHIRQRLFWVANREPAEWRSQREIDQDAYRRDGLGGRSDVGGLSHATGARSDAAQQEPESETRDETRLRRPKHCGWPSITRPRSRTFGRP